MSCTFDTEKLTGFFDGELAAGEKSEVERHVAACSECLRELGEMKAALGLVKTLPRVRAPRSIAEGVSREIATAGRVRQFDAWRRRILWGTAAAAGLFVAVNVLYFVRLDAPTETAGRRSAAPAVAVARTSEAAKPAGTRDEAPADRAACAPGRQELAEGAARRSLEAPAPDPRAREMNRAESEKLGKVELQKDKEAADGLRKAAELPAAPPSSPKPTAPAAAAAPVAKEEAKKADAAPALEQKKALVAELKKDADEKQAQNAQQAANVYLACGTNPNLAQNLVDGWNSRNQSQRGAAPEKRQALVATGGGDLKKRVEAFGGKGASPEPMVVEVTDAEFAELQKELKAKGYLIVEATPAQNKLGYVEMPVPAPGAKLAAADAEGERRKEALRTADAAAKAPAEADGRKDGPARQQTRRITIYFVEQPAADLKK